MCQALPAVRTLQEGLWGIAAGGWTGRWTALFAQDGKEGTYLASMAFGYNDRAGSVLIEVFGWFGLLLVMVAYVVFILNALFCFRFPNVNLYHGLVWLLG